MTEILLGADFVLTMNPECQVLEQAGVLVRDDTIAEIASLADLQARYPAAEYHDYTNHLLMPGLVNCHAHSGLLRGTAEGLPLWEWLKYFIDPMHRALLPEDAAVASQLCYAESLLSGTTTIVDMWRYLAGSAQAAEMLGLRVLLVPYVGEHPDYNYFDTLDDNVQLLETWHGAAAGRIQVWIGIEHLFYADEVAYKRAIALTEKYDVGLHTHSNETQWEVSETLKRYGLRPIQALKHFGLLSPRTLLAHGVWLDETEMDILAACPTGIAHCPTSNMKLASGVCPVEALQARGIPVGLGSDGEKENNNLDLLEEMKIAALLQKVTQMNAAAMDSWQVLKMATIDGARAIGMENQIGSLEVGKKADIIAVQLRHPHLTPIMRGKYFNLHHNLVYAAQSADVKMTMVNGRILVDRGILLTADLQECIDLATHIAQKLFDRRETVLAGMKDE
jgi:5-methylthioadenosine/S-adenosylhomocysteine deaminase